MKLYNFSWGPYPRRVTIYLAEKNIADLELIEVEFPHRPELWPSGFLRNLNPGHSLPVLDLGDGQSIGQSIAILEYLEERYPETNMMGDSPEGRAATRAMVAVLDEATSFFGIWARQGSALNADRHVANIDASTIGAERYTAKLRVVEAMMAGLFLTGESVTVADCVGMALLEFTSGFYGVSIPSDCPKLADWFNRFSSRHSVVPPPYPPSMLAQAYGLPAQTGCYF